MRVCIDAADFQGKECQYRGQERCSVHGDLGNSAIVLMMAHGVDGLAGSASLLRVLVETPLWLQRVGPSRTI
jgi:hypothetical protein